METKEKQNCNCPLFKTLRFLTLESILVKKMIEKVYTKTHSFFGGVFLQKFLVITIHTEGSYSTCRLRQVTGKIND